MTSIPEGGLWNNGGTDDHHGRVMIITEQMLWTGCGHDQK